MKDLDTRAMTRNDLEDEVMLLRAQVKVLRDWITRHKALDQAESAAASRQAQPWEIGYKYD